MAGKKYLDVGSPFTELAGLTRERVIEPVPDARSSAFTGELIPALRRALAAAEASDGSRESWYAVAASLSPLYDFIAEADRYNRHVSSLEGDGEYLVPRSPLRTHDITKDANGRKASRERVRETMRRYVMSEVAVCGGAWMFELVDRRPTGARTTGVIEAVHDLVEAGCIVQSKRVYGDHSRSGRRMWLEPAWTAEDASGS